MALLTPQTMLPPDTRPRRKAAFAVAMLVICCLLWGISFPTAQRAAGMMEAGFHSNFSNERLTVIVAAMFNGWRFLAAALVYLLLSWRSQRGFTAHEVRGGLIIGAFISGGVFLQLLGLRYTVPSVSAFLTSLAVIFAPAAQAILLRRPVGQGIWLSVGLAVAGSIALAWPSGALHDSTLFHEPPLPLLGELLTIAAALLLTGHILAVDHYGRTANTPRLTLLMFATGGVLSLLVGLALGGGWYLSTEGLRLFADAEFSVIFVFLVLGSGVLALHLMNRYQPLIAPAAATVVYCLEPVFATLSSAALGAETLGLTTFLGGGVVLLAVLNVARLTRSK